MSSEPSGPRVKGVAFRSADLSFTELKGEEARAKAHELMVPEARDAFRYGALLASSWYPIEWYRDMFRAFRTVTGEGLELVREIGQRSVRHDMSSIYKRIFVKVISPETLLGISARLFNNYYDTGTLEVVESKQGYARIALRGCVGWDQNMFTEIIGSTQAFLEVAGATNIRSHLLSGGQDGDTGMEAHAFWK